MGLAIYMLVGSFVTGDLAVISSCLVTGEVETTLLCTGALIWGVVGAAVGAIFGQLSFNRPSAGRCAERSTHKGASHQHLKSGTRFAAR